MWGYNEGFNSFWGGGRGNLMYLQKYSLIVPRICLGMRGTPLPMVLGLFCSNNFWFCNFANVIDTLGGNDVQPLFVDVESA